MNNDFKNTGMGRNSLAVQCTVTAEDPLSHTVQPKRKRKKKYIYIHTNIYSDCGKVKLNTRIPMRAKVQGEC